MPVKLLIHWDINAGSESEYNDFIVNEFIRRAKRLGLQDLQFWYTSYGVCEQILASGMTESEEQMQRIIRSEEWATLETRLRDLVTNYGRKLVRAGGGFQL